MIRIPIVGLVPGRATHLLLPNLIESNFRRKWVGNEYVIYWDGAIVSKGKCICDEITEMGAIYICGLNKCVWLIRVYFYRNCGVVVVVVIGGLVESG